jgi:hypothetical protein
MFEQIIVIPYAGYRGDEAPRAFFLGNVSIDVLSILESRVEETVGTRVRRRLFVVRGSDGRLHKLAYDEELDQWFHQSP